MLYSSNEPGELLQWHDDSIVSTIYSTVVYTITIIPTTSGHSTCISGYSGDGAASGLESTKADRHV